MLRYCINNYAQFRGVNVKIYGPYERKNGKAFLRLTDGEKTRLQTFGSVEEAAAAKARLESQAENAPCVAISCDDYDGTHGWWDKCHGKLGRALLQAVEAGDMTRANVLMKVCRAWSQLAQAARHSVDFSELENEHAKMKETIGEILSARKYGTKVSQSAYAGTEKGKI